MSDFDYKERLKTLTHAEKLRADGKYPAVLRFASMHPSDVSKMIAHAERQAGEEEHVDKARSHLNRKLRGNPKTIAEEVMSFYRAARKKNLASNLAGLKKSRPKDYRTAKLAGEQEPWSAQKKSRGPLREGILTVHRDAFRADEDCPSERRLEFIDDAGEVMIWDMRKADKFIAAGREFLEKNFGDMMQYMRVDLDEQSVHFHFLLLDYVDEKPSVRFADGRTLLRTSHHTFIGGDGKAKGYELAQDAVGEWFEQERFAELNIVRGERRAAKRREYAKELDEVFKEVSEDGRDDGISGSKIGLAMRELKRRIAAAADKKGGINRIRLDPAQLLALELLEHAGLLEPGKRHEATTRRARAVLLKTFEEQHGTVHDILQNAEKYVESAVGKARAASEQERATRDKIRSEKENFNAALSKKKERTREFFMRAEKEHAEKLAGERQAVKKERDDLDNEREEFEAERAEFRRAKARIDKRERDMNDLWKAIRRFATKRGFFDEATKQEAETLRGIATGLGLMFEAFEDMPFDPSIDQLGYSLEDSRKATKRVRVNAPRSPVRQR